MSREARRIVFFPQISSRVRFEDAGDFNHRFRIALGARLDRAIRSDLANAAAMKLGVWL
jgi:hypothetical protein